MLKLDFHSHCLHHSCVQLNQLDWVGSCHALNAVLKLCCSPAACVSDDGLFSFPLRVAFDPPPAPSTSCLQPPPLPPPCLAYICSGLSPPLACSFETPGNTSYRLCNQTLYCCAHSQSSCIREAPAFVLTQECALCAGTLAAPVQANTSISTAYTPRISIQPFATPGQHSFVGSYGSAPNFARSSWGGRQ